MKDLKTILSLVKGSGILRFTVGPVVGGIKVIGVGAMVCCTGCCTGCLEVLILSLSWGPNRLGCSSSSLLVCSSLLSVSYSLLLGATILDEILTVACA